MKKIISLLLLTLSLGGFLEAESYAGGVFAPLLNYNSSYDKDQDLPTLNQLYEWYDTPSFLDLYLDLDQDNLRVFTQLDLHTDLMVDLHHDTFSNLPYIDRNGNFYMDPNIPDVGYIEWQDQGLLLSGGRRKIQIGPGAYALGLAGSAPYFDHLALGKEFSMKKSSLTYYFTAIASDRKAMEKVTKSGVGEETPYKTLFTHSFMWQTNRLIVGLSEYNLIYEQQPNLQDMGFTTFYHAFYQDYQNVMDELVVVYKAASDLQVYGSFIMDDYSMAIEDSDSNPSGMGLTFGVRWKHGKAGSNISDKCNSAYSHILSVGSFKDSPGKLELSFDFMWASKYLYNRDVEAGKFTNPMYYSWEYERETMNTFYGALYGPDTVTSKISARWNNGPLLLNASLEWLASGAEGIDISYEPPYENAYVLEGPVTHTVMFDIDTEWSLSEKSALLGSAGFDIQEDDFDFNFGFGYRRIMF